MTVDYAQAAATVAAFLAPFMPYLIEAGKGLSRSLGEGVGETTLEKARAVLSKMRAKLGYDEEIERAVATLATMPEDEESQVLLAKGLAIRLQQSPSLADELVELIGGQEAVQRVTAESSWIEDVVQEIRGYGRQTIEAKDGSVIKGIRQSRS